jgi:hypothetical protein
VVVSLKLSGQKACVDAHRALRLGAWQIGRTVCVLLGALSDSECKLKLDLESGEEA